METNERAVPEKQHRVGTLSTAFNIFANAFVRAKGMPFSVTIQEPVTTISREKMLADTDQMLGEFSTDYKGIAK